jgi:hypothetical protein
MPADIPNMRCLGCEDGVKIFQPYTTDTTPEGMKRARNNIRVMLKTWPDEDVHMWLCHPGKPCEDGCDVPAISERHKLYASEVET